MQVADQTYRILYFEGEPRWEYKFMRRALGDDDDLQIATLLRVSPNKFYRQGIESPEQLADGFPKTRDEMFGYDALIIGSVEAASLTDEQQDIIHDFVSERGGSLLMLAGPNGLGNGGWGQSTSPMYCQPGCRRPTTDTFFRKKASVVLTPQGADDQMLRLADSNDENRDAWNGLPEVADYQVTGNLKPAALTLLNAMTDVGQLPLLITQQFGRGHSYILASGGTWRWQMSMPVEDQSHETFWRQMLRALVASAPNSVSLTASHDARAAREFRCVRNSVMTRSGRSTTSASQRSLPIRMETPALSDLEPSADEPGVFLANISPTASGTWYFEAVAERNGEPVDVARTSIHYESGQAEYFRFQARFPGVAETVGGHRWPATSSPTNWMHYPILLRYSSSGITETDYRPIWDAPAIFLLLLLLKGGEWLLRRRWSTI